MATAPNPVQQNMMARSLLAQTGNYMTKKLQTITAPGLGQQVRVPLDRMGITTGVLLQITIPLTITATATPSPFAPYNLIQLLQYTDYSGLNRHNTSGYQLHALQSLKAGKFFNNAVDGAFLTNAETAIDTNILNVPTAISSANMTFFVYVPLCIDPVNDLRGAVLSQTIYGDHYITLQLPQNLVGTDPYINPYTAGAMTVGAAGIQITAFQHYIMPQQGVANLPMIDLSTIYAIEGGMTDSANISNGATKYLNWPNNRAVLSALHIFNNNATGGVLNGTDISEIILLVNGNTNMRELTPAVMRNHQRQLCNGDLANGVYYMPSRRQPITTQLYGNVQTQINFASTGVGNNSYFSSQYESTYLSGTPLPGVVQ